MIKAKHLGLPMQRRLLVLLIAFVALYTLTVFFTPVNHAVLTKYKLTLDQFRILDVLIIIPLYIIWALAFYGFSAFDSYATLIRRDRDGAAFQKIVRGLMILVIGSVIASLINALFGLYAANHLPTIKARIVVNNYLTMLVTIAAFVFIYHGARRLSELTRKRFHPSGTLRTNLISISLGALYTSLFIARLPAARDVPLTATSHAAYYAPTWLLITTYVVPYLIAWYLGGLAVYLLLFYTRHVGGSLYSRALRYLSYGLAVVVIGSVVVQVLTVLTGQLQNLSAASLILLIYLLLALIAAGYILIAIGAKKLAKIETV